LLAESTTTTGPIAAQWRSLPIEYTFTNGQVLYFGVVSDDWLILSYDIGPPNQTTEFTEDYTTYPTVPNPPTIQSQNDNVKSIFANITTFGNSTISGSGGAGGNVGLAGGPGGAVGGGGGGGGTTAAGGVGGRGQIWVYSW
jgi:hypothetical protein